MKNFTAKSWEQMEDVLQDCDKRSFDLEDVELGGYKAEVRDGDKVALMPHGNVTPINLDNEWGARTLAQNLRIPNPYFKLLQELDPELLVTNINRMLQESGNKKHFMRFYNDDEGNTQLKAVLSSKYLAINNLEVFQTVKQLTTERNLKFEHGHISEDFMMHLNIADESTRGTVKGQLAKVGDEVVAGMVAINSETGRRAFIAGLRTIRLICTNGAVHWGMGEGIKKIHYGRAGVDMPYIFSQYLNLLSTENFNRIMIGMKKSADTAIPNVEQFLLELKRQEKFSDKMLEKVKGKLLEENGGVSYWKAGNVMTELAKDFSGEKREQFEVAGARIFNQK